MAGEKKRQTKDNRDKLKICFVAPLPPPYGGIANWTAMVCNYIDDKKKEEISYEIINTAPKKRVTEGRTLLQRITGGTWNALKNGKQLKKILKSKKIDCVHMTTSGSLSLIRDYILCSVAKRQRVPVVYHIHFGKIPEMKTCNGLAWKIFQRLLERVSAVVAIDKNTYQCLYHVIGECAVYIENPIDTGKLPKREEQPEEIVMYLGWVIKEKGIEELLEAWGKVYSQKKNWVLHIVGPYQKEYYKYLSGRYHMEGVTFFGEQPHEAAMDLLNRASIFLLPSYTEGCPYVIMEAMALAKSVIATAVGNIPEMLAGDCGIVIKPKDSIAIEAALNNCMDDVEKRAFLGINAINKVQNNYLIDKIILKYMDVWRSVCL